MFNCFFEIFTIIFSCQIYRKEEELDTSLQLPEYPMPLHDITQSTPQSSQIPIQQFIQDHSNLESSEIDPLSSSISSHENMSLESDGVFIEANFV